MSEDDQKAFKLYGKAPAKNMLSEIRKVRQYLHQPSSKVALLHPPSRLSLWLPVAPSGSQWLPVVVLFHEWMCFHQGVVNVSDTRRNESTLTRATI